MSNLTANPRLLDEDHDENLAPPLFNQTHSKRSSGDIQLKRTKAGLPIGKSPVSRVISDENIDQSNLPRESLPSLSNPLSKDINEMDKLGFRPMPSPLTGHDEESCDLHTRSFDTEDDFKAQSQDIFETLKLDGSTEANPVTPLAQDNQEVRPHETAFEAVFGSENVQEYAAMPATSEVYESLICMEDGATINGVTLTKIDVDSGSDLGHPATQKSESSVSLNGQEEIHRSDTARAYNSVIEEAQRMQQENADKPVTLDAVKAEVQDALESLTQLTVESCSNIKAGIKENIEDLKAGAHEAYESLFRSDNSAVKEPEELSPYEAVFGTERGQAVTRPDQQPLTVGDLEFGERPVK